MAYTYREASSADAGRLAPLNAALIRDEGHRNEMSVPELARRMRAWLDGDYTAWMIQHDSAIVGYVLYRWERGAVYLRQFYVDPEHRRRGVGRDTIAWLRAQPWKDALRIRLDVLTGNEAGIAFWRSLGFADYCLTMELEV